MDKFNQLYNPNELVRDVERDFPEMWKDVQHLLSESKRDWEPWCFLPVGAILAIILHRTPKRRTPREQLLNAHVAPALVHTGVCWRYSRSTFAFDDGLKKSLLEMELGGKIPRDILFRLPHYCCYIEVNMPTNDLTLCGFFVTLEDDKTNGRAELRILAALKAEQQTFYLPVFLHLTSDSIEECLEGFYREIERQGAPHGVDVRGTHAPRLQAVADLALRFVLYICASNADIRLVEGRDPKRSLEQKSVKGGVRIFPPAPSFFVVGKTVGESLRTAREKAQTQGGWNVAPHIRRAHWHTFRVGPGRTQSELKWLPPTFVGSRETEEI